MTLFGAPWWMFCNPNALNDTVSIPEAWPPEVHYQMPKYRGALALSNELLHEILECIAIDPDKLVDIDKRAYLSQESFLIPPPPPPSHIETIIKFRCLCRRFNELGAQYMYPRVTTRFSKSSFKRLEQIANRPHLAEHVKKFSYLVPCFYSIDPLPEPIRDVTSLLRYVEDFNVDQFLTKVRDQRWIRETQLDVRVLGKAIASFTSLKHVQILRVQDRQDEKLLSFLREHHDMQEFVHLDWAPACYHSARTIGAALSTSKSPMSHFSSPMVNPASALELAGQPQLPLTGFAENLTCLILHFEEGAELDSRMSDLSPAFKAVFQAATGLEALHVGFPSHRPLNRPLESIFHNIEWEKLKAFGVQGWRLDANEIIALVLRHRDRLKGLRLRDVLLNDGSRWKDVLGVLRDEVYRLEWVSLRRIGYATTFDQYWATAGIEVPEDPPGGDSDSDEGSVDLYDFDHDQDLQAGPSSRLSGEAGSSFGFGSNGTDHSDHGDDSDDEHGPHSHELDFPPLHSPTIPSSVPWCVCNCLGNSGDIYPPDDGDTVDNTKRKLWEQWVLRKCPEHNPRG